MSKEVDLAWVAVWEVEVVQNLEAKREVEVRQEWGVEEEIREGLG